MTAPYLEHHIDSPDGLTLYARDYASNAEGAAGRLPVVCLAGLTRNSRDFHPLAVMLSRDAETPRRVITIDTRGRGGSQWDVDTSRYTVPHEAGDVIAVLKALGIDRAAFIGTSRGGLILHVLAAVQPQLLGAVILNDVGPAIGIEGLRHIQSYLGQRPGYPGLSEAAQALERVHGPAFPKLTRRTGWNLRRQPCGRRTANSSRTTIRRLPQAWLRSISASRWRSSGTSSTCSALSLS